MNETLLIYHITREERINCLKKICTPLHIRIRQVKKEEYLKTIFQLLGGEKTGAEKKYQGEELPGEMLVMAVNPDKIDSLLDGMKKEGISVPYKAIVTPDNGWWNSLQLYQELEKEHRSLFSGFPLR